MKRRSPYYRSGLGCLGSNHVMKEVGIPRTKHLRHVQQPAVKDLQYSSNLQAYGGNPRPGVWLWLSGCISGH